MKAKLPGQEFSVVIKLPRRKWKIPHLDAMAQVQRLEQEEAARKMLTEGTTPFGRELLRKLMYLCEKGLRAGKEPNQVATEVASYVLEFAMLREEWSLLLSRMWKISYSNLNAARPFLFAMIVASVIKAKTAATTQNQPNRNQRS